jgi:hypothetical protein|tara:strand:- start:272 stop:463 length:192 start_codon:yes stop_codon:yes gene_type:complete
MKMTKKISIIITIAFMMISTGCSTYNSLVPDFATIGSSSVSETIENNKNNSEEASWWNPFSWF